MRLYVCAVGCMFGWMLRVDPAPWNSLPGEADGLDGTGSRGWSVGSLFRDWGVRV